MTSWESSTSTGAPPFLTVRASKQGLKLWARFSKSGSLEECRVHVTVALHRGLGGKPAALAARMVSSRHLRL
jgi:hypothetical protein